MDANMRGPAQTQPKLEQLEPRLLLSTFVVNSTADPGDGTLGDGQITLREAIAAANANAGFDNITFDIPTSDPGYNAVTGAFAITPASVLPTITDAVNVDGYSQAGAQANTNPIDQGSNAILKIELDGTGAGAGVSGLHLTADNSTIRGLVINRFGQDGIVIDAGTSNVVKGNFLGTDVTGTIDRGNGGQGVRVENGASSNTIGGAAPEARNIISGNDWAGVVIHGVGSTGNQVLGNTIGLNAAGTAPVPNGNGVGIIEGASNNTVGGTTAPAGNVIAGNDELGIGVWGEEPAGTGNTFLRNSIFGNGTLGIDLSGAETADGVTANDAGDADVGPNAFQNFPVLPSVTATTITEIEGTLNSTPGTSFRIEFFANSQLDASGHGEGQTYIGYTHVTTDAGGNVAFDVILPGAVPAWQWVAAMATDLSTGDTSEFSGAVQVLPGAPSGQAYAIADETDLFGQVDPDTGAFTVIGLLQNAAGTVVYDDVENLAVDPVTGTIYGINHGSALITIDPLTGIATEVGDPGLTDVDAQTFHPVTGELYAIDATGATNPGVLYQIDKTTAAATLVTALTAPAPDPLAGRVDPHVDGMAFDPGTGVLLGAYSPWNGPTYLVTVDVTTGQLTVIGACGVDDVEDIAFAPSGTLFGVLGDVGDVGSGDYEGLVAIDPATGAAAPVGQFGTPPASNVWDMEALAFLPRTVVGTGLMYPTEAFVRSLYRGIYYSQTDPLGLQGYIWRLDTGMVTRAQAVEEFVNCPVFHAETAPVIRFYMGILQRLPDKAGLHSWVTAFKDGWPLEDIAVAFATCPEAVGLHGNIYNNPDDGAFVDWLYQTVLGRAPSAQERLAGINALGGGTTRGQLILTVTESPEFMWMTDNHVYVTVMYTALFGRTPDDSGADAWAGYLAAGHTVAEMAEQFLNHAEYAENYARTLFDGVLLRLATDTEAQTWGLPLSNGLMTGGAAIEGMLVSAEFEQWVAPIFRLYTAVLQRLPDPVGLWVWVSRYRGGASFEQIAMQFVTHPESVALHGDVYNTLNNGDFVDWVYQTVLERAPAAQERQDALNGLAGGGTREQLVVALTESAEYMTATQDERQVAMAYLALAGRIPDPATFDNWLEYFQAGHTLEELGTMLLCTPERALNWTAGP